MLVAPLSHRRAEGGGWRRNPVRRGRTVRTSGSLKALCERRARRHRWWSDDGSRGSCRTVRHRCL